MHPIFSCLTHIEMSPVFSGDTDATTSLLPLSHLPRPTHLAFLACGTSLECMQISQCPDLVQADAGTSSFSLPTRYRNHARPSFRVHAIYTGNIRAYHLAIFFRPLRFLPRLDAKSDDDSASNRRILAVFSTDSDRLAPLFPGRIRGTRRRRRNTFALEVCSH
ncbi:hypothetical protein C8R43DRAFT_612853 [Mycena crocata]|nr:hypothetical protein C8R43DRAFT_612853 [Mycena crocata]